MQNMFSGSKAMGDLFSTLAIYAVIIGGMYFFLFRPQQKKRKQEDEMRQNVKTKRRAEYARLHSNRR